MVRGNLSYRRAGYQLKRLGRRPLAVKALAFGRDQHEAAPWNDHCLSALPPVIALRLEQQLEAIRIAELQELLAPRVGLGLGLFCRFDEPSSQTHPEGPRDVVSTAYALPDRADEPRCRCAKQDHPDDDRDVHHVAVECFQY